MFGKSKQYVKHTKRVLIVCLILSSIHILYLVHRNKWPTTHSSLKNGKGYRLIKYFEDLSSGFLVVEKSYKINQSEAEGTNLQEGDVNDDKYNIETIEGYKYEKETDINRQQQVLHENASVDEKMEYETRFVEKLVDFFNDLFVLIEANGPGMGSVNNNEHYKTSREENKYPHREGRVPVYGGHLRENYLEEPIRTKEMLESYLRLSKEEVLALTNSQSKFVEQMPTEYPQEMVELSKFNKFLKGDGIVYLGGGKYNQLVMLSLKLLRSHGSQLPVEVIIPKRDDFDIDFCNRVLPNLNANCKVMSDYLPEKTMSTIGGFQFKTVALLISSFENVLYLDADNLPIKNVDLLFTNKPFTDKHLVLWPDLWRRSTSPTFYDIAHIPTDSTKRVRNSYFLGDARGTSGDILYHDCEGTIPEASSETGQILINKKVHFKTLVLAMYYNFYGPKFYYPLLSQGAAGEGDKETFLAAAHKFKLPYYQVQEFNREFGPLDPNTNKHNYFGMGQYDPIIDCIQSSKHEKYLNPVEPTYGKSNSDTRMTNYEYHMFRSSSLLFLHANWPKYYVRDMLLGNSNGRGPKDGNGKRRRLYDNNLIGELNGYDFELHIMKELKWCFCNLVNINLADVPNARDTLRGDICNEIHQQIDFLKNNK